VGVPFQFEQQINADRLKGLGMGEVSPEAPASRKKGEAYTREGVRDLLNKVRWLVGLGWVGLGWAGLGWVGLCIFKV